MNESMQTAAGPLELGDRLDVSEAAAVAGKLKELLETAGDEIEIGLAGVQVVDTAGLQLMIAFAREAQTRGKVVRFSEPSSAFSDAARLLGLVEEFTPPVPRA